MADVALAFADDTEKDWFEIIEGVKIMAASARFDHNSIALKIAIEISAYAKTHDIFVVPDVDVYLSDSNIFRPDICVINSSSDIGEDGKVHGVPALVVEILSPSTMKNDLGKKKILYAKNGVKEYWIVNSRSKDVLVYKLNDENYYELDEAYHAYTQGELDGLDDEARAEVKENIQSVIFSELSIDVKELFRGLPD